MRTEQDFLGNVIIPDNALYGAQTARAIDNFSFNYKTTSPLLIDAFLLVKKSASLVWAELEKGTAEEKKYKAISDACDKLLSERNTLDFCIDALQGGAGTSTNMNVNEVLANQALKLIGEDIGKYNVIHPLDHVNRAQSTNDTYPTALRIACILKLRELSTSCAELQEALQKKENEFDFIKKLGRTELMDAVPVTLGSEFGCYAQSIARDRWRLYKVEERLRQVNIGGAAVGIIENIDRKEHSLHQKYQFLIIEKLRALTGIGLALAEYPMDITQNNDVFVEVSGLLKALSVNLMKIAGDFRLMNSGPNGGIGEIKISPLQAGSTIMPGKINPVIPESIIQIGIKVQANDYCITTAASRGEFELNAFTPLIADSILESLILLNRAVFIFRKKCVETIAADKDRCNEILQKTTAFAAAYVPKLGYDRVRDIIIECKDDTQEIKKRLEES